MLVYMAQWLMNMMDAICCNMLQYVAICCYNVKFHAMDPLHASSHYHVSMYVNHGTLVNEHDGCNMLQYVAICCNMLQYVVIM